jgi:hypothetical protein
MKGKHEIQWLKSRSIDRVKWDRCIEHSDNGLLYATSVYLDHMSSNWDALVLNDYEAVMPLTWKRKYGIHYLYQPFLTAQLGVFGKNINAELVASFLNAVPGKFKYWDIYLNYGNNIHVPGFTLYERMNFILDLGHSYDELRADYSENTRRNIRKSEQAGCILKKDFPVNQVMDAAKEQMKRYDKPLSSDFGRFHELFKALQQRNMATTYGIFSGDNKLLASAVFFYSTKRAYYILVGNDPAGKSLGASHALIDGFIKEHAGKKMLLDFEGSDIQNLGLFYKSFGARNENFAGLKINRLPPLLKWLKK